MLSVEWEELETLGNRLKSLYNRHAAAERSEHGKVVEGLKQEVARVQRQRDVLLRYILVRYGVYAAERNRSLRAATPPSGERI